MRAENKAVKYGTTRHQIYDITVVNPLGEIVRLGTRLKKQSTGYMLDGLIIGSEGTLGIITNATVKLLPPFYRIKSIFWQSSKRRKPLSMPSRIYCATT